MKQFIKNGVLYHGGIIELNGMTIYNPTEDMLIKSGWEEYIEPEVEEYQPTEEELAEMEAQRLAEIEARKVRELASAKAKKIDEIAEYDSSSAVNSFSYQGVQMWIPKELRISLMNSSSIEKASGKTDTSLWYEGVRFDLPIDTLQMLLGAIEMYALECYNVTESHKASVRAMTSVEEIEGYDYRQGYPDKLVL